MAANTMYLYGKNPVIERLKANPKSIQKIFLQDTFDDREVVALIQSKRIAIERVNERKLTHIKRADRLQGIVAEVEPFRYAALQDLLSQPKEAQPSLILLDNINDPHNLGSIIRTVACFGRFAIVIPQHNSCDVNETVLHVASGGENFVPIAMVANLSNALVQTKEAGLWAVGAVVEGGQDITKTSLPFPLSLVLGSEGKGIRHGLENKLELKVQIPMIGASLSFNVAMACSVFCYEIARQRNA